MRRVIGRWDMGIPPLRVVDSEWGSMIVRDEQSMIRVGGPVKSQCGPNETRQKGHLNGLGKMGTSDNH